MKKLSLIAAGIAAAALCSCAPALASGLPTVDGANLAQNLTTSIQAYQQRLQSYTTQLQQLQRQIEAYERQVKDATRPYKQVYDQAYKAYSQTMEVVNGINNIRNNYASTIDFIRENFGDSDFWKQCAASGCDPTDQLNLAEKARLNVSNYSSELGQDAVKQAQGSLDQVRDIEAEVSASGDQGTATALQNLTKMQARTAEIIAENVKLENQMIQAKTAAEATSSAKTKAMLVEWEKAKNTPLQDTYKSPKMYTALDYMK